MPMNVRGTALLPSLETEPRRVNAVERVVTGLKNHVAGVTAHVQHPSTRIHHRLRTIGDRVPCDHDVVDVHEPKRRAGPGIKQIPFDSQVRVDMRWQSGALRPRNRCPDRRGGPGELAHISDRVVPEEDGFRKEPFIRCVPQLERSFGTAATCQSSVCVCVCVRARACGLDEH